jgi:tight adherence protein C
VNALIQSYEMGTGVATTLRVQSEMLRNKRVQRAEEKANKIPVKMIIPIYIFLFPAIFVAMGGPLAVMMIKAVSKMFSGMEGLS